MAAAPLVFKDVKAALYAWVAAALPLLKPEQVVWQFGLGTQPMKPYVSLNLIGPVPVGFAETELADPNVVGEVDTITGVRTATVSVNCVSDPDPEATHLQMATDLQMSLELPEFYEPLTEAGITVLNVMQAQDVSEALETKQVRRAQFDVTVQLSSSLEAKGLGQISTVTIQNPLEPTL